MRPIQSPTVPAWRAAVAHGLWLCVAALALAGCASAPARSPAPPPLRDDRFAAPSRPVEGAAEIFALNDGMRAYLKDHVAAWRAQGRQRSLVEALYTRSQLKFEYDSSRTRNAGDAFDARAGNCLSLAIMTAAFARALDIPVRFQSATIDDTWTRAGTLALRSGHLNVTLGRRLLDAGTARDQSALTVDFLPGGDLHGLRVQEVDEATVVAMYQNNRAAEALARGEVDDAYWWARAAVQAGTPFQAPWNTLGVVYQRRGDLGTAEQIFRELLARRPRDTEAMANLARLLAGQPGRAAEAEDWRRRLAAVEPLPPFHHYALGRAAAERGDDLAARELLLRELDRSDFHEVHHWLAIVESRLGHPEEARRQLALGQQASSSRGDRERYGAKLAALRRGRDPGAPAQ